MVRASRDAYQAGACGRTVEGRKQATLRRRARAPQSEAGHRAGIHNVEKTAAQVTVCWQDAGPIFKFVSWKRVSLYAGS
jgi:hypothetical protein